MLWPKRITGLFRQSGYTGFKMANFSDVHLIEKARKNAQAVFEKDPDFILPEDFLIKQTLTYYWPEQKGDVS